jgi:hypothetical protein
MLQPVDFTQNRVEIDEYKPPNEEKKIEGPRKSTVTVSSRRAKDEDKPTEYTLKCHINDKPKTWLGKSEESSKYAVLSFDGNEVRIVLTDHWYKFSPIFHSVSFEKDSEKDKNIGKDIKIGKIKRQKEEAELVKEVIGEDSDEGEPKKRPRLPRKMKSTDSGGEGMDFSEEFADDEEIVNDDIEETEETALKQSLSMSGKELQKVLLQENYKSSSDDDDSDSIGISDSESDREGVNKQAVINELMRLGKTTLKDLIAECSRKFKNEVSLKQQLSDIIREISEITGTGENAEIVLKEEYKKVVPSFGVRIHFQTKK